MFIHFEKWWKQEKGTTIHLHTWTNRYVCMYVCMCVYIYVCMYTFAITYKAQLFINFIAFYVWFLMDREHFFVILCMGGLKKLSVVSNANIKNK